jgi:EAL domain-containing protein (putative c-di-GMP-specific phosphodiesterase class I)
MSVVSSARRPVRVPLAESVAAEAARSATPTHPWIAKGTDLPVPDVGRSHRSRFDRAMDQLYLVYQPIVSWSTRRIVGLEALCRSGEPGITTADALLDEAESTGRVRELGRAVRSRVADLLRHVPSHGALLFVNLHADELGDPELCGRGGLLAHWSHRVVFEITERRRLADLRAAAARTDQLRQLGYRIALDDLGSGYSGLGCMAALAPDVVKLDRSLITGIDVDPMKQAMVEGLVEMAARMGICTIAEGVETDAELDALYACGCDLMQGYLFGHPRRSPAL